MTHAVCYGAMCYPDFIHLTHAMCYVALSLDSILLKLQPFNQVCTNTTQIHMHEQYRDNLRFQVAKVEAKYYADGEVGSLVCATDEHCCCC
jgi:hypothetical protein